MEFAAPVILAVDDEVESLHLLTEILQAEGYEVRAANSGRLALASAASSVPDLVLLDFRMPGMDGLDVCRRLKQIEATHETPVIFLSGIDQVEQRVEALASGAVDFVSKPFRREELLARVRIHLELERLRTGLEREVECRTAELRQSEARLASAIKLAGLGFYEVDFGERTSFRDDRVRDLLGIPPEEDEGFKRLEFWVEHLHADDAPGVLDIRDQLRDGRLDYAYAEYRFQHPVRGRRWIHHLASVYTRDSSGRAVRTYGVMRDITERREAEESLRKSYAEIESLKDRLQAEGEYLRAEMKLTQNRGDIIGQSAAIEEALELAEQVAPTDSNVLVIGETGTGKELFAEAIHRLSPRRGKVMIKVNCAALPAGLIESELFGREKGAFTGAMTRQVGRFEIADGSTLFLDEIGDLPLDLQVKLLRVLESGEFERLGSSKTIKVNVRVVAATNRNLPEAIKQGKFREDLYYRLKVFPLKVPPLRERAEDIPLLVWAFIQEFSLRMGKKITQVAPKAMDALQRHPWPGNVRELRNFIEHAAIMTKGETLWMPNLDETVATTGPSKTLVDVERKHILQVLEKAKWRIKGPKGAAAELGLNPATLYGRMKKLGIPFRGDRDADPA